MGNQPQDTAVSVASDSDMADGTSHEDESPRAPVSISSVLGHS